METKNPFSNGRVLGANTDPRKYHAPQKRGDKSFVMSRSELSEFTVCPHKWRVSLPEDDIPKTDALKWGSAMDCLLLMPDLFREIFAIQPETYPAPAHHAKVKKGEIEEGDPLPWNANAGFCSDWKDEQEGKIILSDSIRKDCDIALEALKADEQIWSLLACSEKQVHVIAEFRDDDTGLIVPVKALLDLVPNVSSPAWGKVLADFKTSYNVHPARWSRHCFDQGYHVQAAFFTDIYVAATGEDRCDFRHICQESSPPFEIGKRIFSSGELDMIEVGRMTYISALKKYCRCLFENRWPGYDDGPRTIDGWSPIDAEAWMVK